MNKLFLYDQIPTDRERFAARVEAISQSLGIEANHLMLVMYLESKLNPAARNPYGSATGLIQFTEATAQSLGTTTARLRLLSGVDQLYYVKMYLDRYKNKIHSLGDLYLSIFYPAALGRSSSDLLSLSSQWVSANKIFDLNKDGKITVGEVQSYILSYFNTLADRFKYKVFTPENLGLGLAAVTLLLLYLNR